MIIRGISNRPELFLARRAYSIETIPSIAIHDSVVQNLGIKE